MRTTFERPTLLLASLFALGCSGAVESTEPTAIDEAAAPLEPSACPWQHAALWGVDGSGHPGPLWDGSEACLAVDSIPRTGSIVAPARLADDCQDPSAFEPVVWAVHSSADADALAVWWLSGTQNGGQFATHPCRPDELTCAPGAPASCPVVL